MDYLPVAPSEVPVKKTFAIGGNSYKYEFRYNSRFDFYTCYIYDINDVLLYSAKVIYGNSLIHAQVDGLTVAFEIVPFNIDQFFSEYMLDTTVNAANLDSRVKLFINNPLVET